MKHSKVKIWLSVTWFVFIFLCYYGQFWREYSVTLLILLSAGLVCIEIRETLKRRGSKDGVISDELFLAASGILIGILIFVLQNLQSLREVNNVLVSATEYNCVAAKELKEEIAKTKELKNISPRIRGRYITEQYKANMGYLLSKFDKEESEIVFNAIRDMDEANRFLDLSLANFSEFPNNILSSDGKKFNVNFEAHVNIGKVYDNEVLNLSRKALDGLKIINSNLGSASVECVEH